MKFISLTIAMLAGSASALAGGGNCVNGSDIPVAFSISSTDSFSGESAAITSDSSQAYVNGQQGVAAVIQACTGNNDATLNLNRSKRAIGFNFSNVVYPNSAPSWVAATPSFFSQAFFNIHDMYDQNRCPPSMQCSFTTQFTSNFTAPDGKTYNLRFLNLQADTQFGNVSYLYPSEVNFPNQTWMIQVIHMPASSATPETWTIYPLAGSNNPATSTDVGGLLTTSGKTTVGAGQFSMPFYITITRL